MPNDDPRIDLKSCGCAAHRPARPVDARGVRVVLLLRLSGADLSADLAARAISHLWRQYRVGHNRGHGVHAWPRSRQPRRRLAVEAARHPVAAAAWRHRVDDRDLWSPIAQDFRPGQRVHRRSAIAGDGRGQSGAGDRSDLVDGSDAAGSGRPSGPSFRPCGERARPSLLRQYAGRRRSVPRLCCASLSVRRHAGRGVCRRRDQCGGGGGRLRRLLARSPRSDHRHGGHAGGVRGAPADARARAGAGARRCRRLRVAVLRNLLFPHRLLCHRFERDRLRLDAGGLPDRAGLGLAASRPQLRGFAAGSARSGARSPP